MTAAKTIAIFRHLIVGAFLAALCWFAHFSGFKQLGFYEDDHAFAAEVLTWTPHDALEYVWNQARWFPMPQGRPIGFALGHLLPYLGWKLDGVPGMYLIGWLILSLNAILVYQLIRRCLPAPMPVIIAIGFIFFPADTTRPFLCHAHILQPAVTFTLLACHLNLSTKWKWWAIAYLPLLLTLLTYETAMLPLVVFPLLHKRWDRRWLMRFALHLLAIGIVVGLIAAIRQGSGEERVTTAHGQAGVILDLIERGTRIGINTSLRMCRVRAVQGLTDFLAHIQHRVRINMLTAGAVLSIGVLLTYLLATTRELPKSTVQLLLDLGRAALFGITGLLISYVFCFTHFPPDFELGRLTSTHLAATLPISTLMAVIACLPLLIPPAKLSSVFTAGAVGLYFMLLYGAASDEQAGYIAIWNARKNFWVQVLDLCPDVTDRTLIVADNQIPRPSYYMESSSWSEYIVLFQCYDFPASMPRKPMAFCFHPTPAGYNWQGSAVATADGQVGWKPNPFGHETIETVQDGNLILLHVDDAGTVTRESGTITLAGKPIHLKPAPPLGMACPYPTLPMYTLIKFKENQPQMNTDRRR